jgi:hypothetical protein
MSILRAYQNQIVPIKDGYCTACGKPSISSEGRNGFPPVGNKFITAGARTENKPKSNLRSCGVDLEVVPWLSSGQFGNELRNSRRRCYSFA